MNTMLELDYDLHDLHRWLISLQASDYLESLKDNLNPCSPPFYVFINEIQQRQVYIKIKVRVLSKKQMFCISFHFVRYPITNPRPYD